jgi:MSHA biogenesis protein MshK
MRGGSVFRSVLVVALLLPSPLLLAADPTLPPRQPLPGGAGQSAPPPEALQLQAILRGEKSARVVINGQTLRVGQRVSGARIVSIDARSVSIERQGKRSTLHLLSPLLSPSRNTP